MDQKQWKSLNLWRRIEDHIWAHFLCLTSVASFVWAVRAFQDRHDPERLQFALDLSLSLFFLTVLVGIRNAVARLSNPISAREITEYHVDDLP